MAMSRKRIEATSSWKPQSKHEDSEQVTKQLEALKLKMAYPKAMAKWLKIGLHRLYFLWIFSEGKTPDKKKLCASYQITTKCANWPANCPFDHDANLRKSFGTSQREIVQQILTAKPIQNAETGHVQIVPAEDAMRGSSLVKNEGRHHEYQLLEIRSPT